MFKIIYSNDENAFSLSKRTQISRPGRSKLIIKNKKRISKPPRPVLSRSIHPAGGILLENFLRGWLMSVSKIHPLLLQTTQGRFTVKMEDIEISTTCVLKSTGKINNLWLGI